MVKMILHDLHDPTIKPTEKAEILAGEGRVNEQERLATISILNDDT
jgi:hypothetical protein